MLPDGKRFSRRISKDAHLEQSFPWSFFSRKIIFKFYYCTI